MKKILLLLAVSVTSQNFAQFSQSFEGSTTTPAGWTVIAGGDAAETWEVTDLSTSNAIQAQNGTNVFSINYGATAHNDFLVTPQFTVVAGVTDKLTFWGRSRDPLYPETIAVKASTTTATAAAFSTVLIASVAPASGSTFYKYTVDLANYVGQTLYVGFQSTTTDQFVFDIDNVVLGSTVACLEPTSPLTLSPTSSSVTVSWTAATPAPAEGYDIFHSASGTAPTSNAIPSLSVGAGVTTGTISNLTPGTKYYFYVRSKCSSTVSSVWGHLGVVVTAVLPPYSYGFDNAAGFTADSWSGTWSTNATAGNPQAGTQMVFSNNSATAATNRWLFSRPIMLQENSVNTITFYLRNFTAANPVPGQSIKLTVGNTAVAANHTNVLWTSSTVNNTTWTQFTATFTPTTSGVYYFGFHHFSPIQTATVSLGLDTFALSSTLSTEDFTAKKFIVSPNPVKDLLTIANEFQTIQAVEVYDLNGRQVKNVSNNATNLQISLGDLSSGVYLLKIQTPQGISTQKIIKE
ncbi:hypothetical protein J2X31_003399 [Flavobacterium arsenatis]|uniref:Fibronectin type-III domain-containing protein n=1 Tax=Flavobacterium arsenatis TaxID=1484332 RepID=A0ABU1TU11_9FLAO|nr:choice-of-anchor J domain-containing protein [Flavobacterium arsenatis]MDR6969368.1 hypothetical protein [Flavobacterium arsenatis]